MIVGDPTVHSGFPITTNFKTDPEQLPWNTNANVFVVNKLLQLMQAQIYMRNAQMNSPGLETETIDYGGLGDFETYSHLLKGLGGTKYD